MQPVTDPKISDLPIHTESPVYHMDKISNQLLIHANLWQIPSNV